MVMGWQVVPGRLVSQTGHALASKEDFLFFFLTLPTSELEQARADRLLDPGMVREIHFCGGKPSCKIKELCQALSLKKVKQNVLTMNVEFEHLHVGKGHRG